MDTARIDIAYRPLRVAWVIHSNDFDAFRKTVRLSHTLWGGRFNPIVFADRAKDARDLINVFRVDMLMPVGASPEVINFAAGYQHLPAPYYADGLFVGDGKDARAVLLDVDNALTFAREKRVLEELAKSAFRTFVWDPGDPLADLLLIQLGAYPRKDECPIDYASIFGGALLAIDDTIRTDEPLPARIYDHPSVAFLSRHGLQRHYSIPAGWWESPGFFVGDVTNLDDLVSFWNLRAADKSLQFIDRENSARFELLRPLFEKETLESIAHLDEPRRRIAVWARDENIEDAGKRFEGRLPLTLSRVGEHSWNGLNIQVPMMILGEASTLGVFGDSSGKPRLSFALSDKPFSGDIWFHNQHLVASVSIIGADGLDQRHTFLPPYVPELNVYLGRSMHFDIDRVRIEPERLGLVVDAVDKDAFIYGISPPELFVEIFRRAGVSAKPSPAGLIARQLITQLGGVDGGRVFKIPGVRRLIKQHGPTSSFNRKTALHMIGAPDPDRPNARFADHVGLFIEPREEDDLTPSMVFAYLGHRPIKRIPESREG